MSVLTVDDLETYYGFRVAERNGELVGRALETSEDICLRYIGLKNGLAASVTEYFDGDSPILSLGYAPVLSISSVSIDASRAFAETLDESLYRLDGDCGTVHLYVKTFTSPDSIRVVYSAGYSALPKPVGLAIAMTAQKILQDMQNNMVGVLSRTMEGGSETLDNNLPTLAVKQVLDQFRIKRAK